MRTIALMVALACSTAFAQPLEVDTPLSIPIDRGEATTTDGSSIFLDRGLYLNAPAAVLVAKALRGCEAENKALKKELSDAIENPKSDDRSLVPVVAAVTAVVLAIGAGFAAGKLIK